MKRKKNTFFVATRRTTYLFMVFAILVVMSLATFGGYRTPLQSKGNAPSPAAGSLADMTISDPRQVDGRAVITITLGKATVDSIKISQGIAKTANNIAQATDLVDIAEVAAKGYTGKYSKIRDAVKDFLSSKLTPPQIAQAVLQLTTGKIADAVDQNCLVQAVKAAKRDAQGRVTVTRSTNFFTEKSNWYDGWYLYSQNEWSGGCKEKKACLQFLYSNGKNAGCWY